MSGDAYEPTEQQALGIERCVEAVGDQLGVALSRKGTEDLRRLALPLVWEGMSPKYIIARMLLEHGHPGLWEQVRKELV